MMSRVGCRSAAERLLVLAAAWGALTACREPTQITVEVSAESCNQLAETSITVGRLSSLEGRPPSAYTSSCEPNGKIGSLVVVPSGADDEEVAVRVVSAYQPMSPDGCVAADYVGGCIVARRALRFVPHTPLTLPIEMSASCLDVQCPDDQTCLDGVCTTPVITNPEQCASSSCQPPPGDAGPDDGGPPDSGLGDLVLRLTFDATTLDDSSGYGNHGTIVPAYTGAVSYVQGKTGLSARLTAPSTIQIAASESIDSVSGPYTISVWVFPMLPPSVPAILLGRAAPNLAQLYGLQVNQELKVCAYSTGALTCSATPLPQNDWRHLAVTYDGSTLRLYRDGTYQGQGSGTNGPTSNPVVIGSQFIGGFDEIRLYRRALGESEIKALFTNPSAL